jgi:hypothetical protein
MGYNPWLAAAKAAWTEVSSLEAREFFQMTAIQHTLMVIFGIADLCVGTVEAGRMTREFIHDWAQKPTVATAEAEVAIAGLLPPATMPITTQSIVQANKLEQQITQSLRDFYNNEFHQECDPMGKTTCPEARLESDQKPHRNRGAIRDKTTKTAPGGPGKTRSASGSGSKADNKKTSGRVPRSRGKVLPK